MQCLPKIITNRFQSSRCDYLACRNVCDEGRLHLRRFSAVGIRRRELNARWYARTMRKSLLGQFSFVASFIMCHYSLPCVHNVFTVFPSRIVILNSTLYIINFLAKSFAHIEKIVTNVQTDLSRSLTFLSFFIFPFEGLLLKWRYINVLSVCICICSFT